MHRNIQSLKYLFLLALACCAFICIAPRSAAAQATLEDWDHQTSEALLDYYTGSPAPALFQAPISLGQTWGKDAQAILALPATPGAPYPYAVGQYRARIQQALIVEMAHAIKTGNVDRAKALRVELALPRGVSANEGALVLQTLKPGNFDQASKLLTREAVTWQTTRVRQLLDEAVRSTQGSAPLPGRLLERLGEASTLADLPPALKTAGDITTPELPAALQTLLTQIRDSKDWAAMAAPVQSLSQNLLSALPSLLSDKERERRGRLLLKLVILIPQEYSAGVRDGQIVVPLEYREAVTFTAQARQIVGELAPLWLAEKDPKRVEMVPKLDEFLDQARLLINNKANKEEVTATFASLKAILENDFGINIRRYGTTADIVDEVMLETRTLLSSSLASALAGQWEEAERLRVEAYTTYDPELEARLMPRDPQLAMNIERQLLDGIDDKPGVKVLLDKRAGAAELTDAYGQVNASLEQATAMLKSSISPTAAAMNAASIILREGLEGLLVVIAILAGLRGPENANRRKLIWAGIIASAFATCLTWVLSQTIVTSLRAYGEIIAVISGVLAIIVLLLITNWLFHQVYWHQWVSTLKNQAKEGQNPWQLVLAGFLLGYREGFEIVLFLQSLVLDAGTQSVGIGVAIGTVSLVILGFAALKLGLKLPYFKILLVTAALIGVVLVTFVGNTIRGAQTVGWIPVHRMMPGSWPQWIGSWFGFYNTWESILAQAAVVIVVLGTWRVARWSAKNKAAKNQAERDARNTAAIPDPQTLGSN